MRSSLCFIGIQILAWMARGALAEEPRQIRPQAQEIAAALKDVGTQYGPDVSLLGAALLAEAIQAGAIDETAISVAGVVEEAGQHYLQLNLETGIVYNDHDVANEEQVRRLWNIIETCLLRFKSFNSKEDGLSFRLGYKRLSSEPPVDFYQALKDGKASTSTLEIFVHKNDLGQMLAGQQSAQATLDGSIVRHDGRSTQIKLAP